MISVAKFATLTGMSEKGNRLRQARVGAGFSKARQAAERFGWKPSTYAAHENGQNEFDEKQARVYGQAFQISWMWLLTGEWVGPITSKRLAPQSYDPDELAGPHTEVEPNETRAIALVDGRRNTRHVAADATPEMDVRGGASYAGGYALPSEVAADGGRTYSGEVVKAEWKFPASWLRDELRLSISKTDVISIIGPSMAPELVDGDRVLIDRTHTDPRQGGIFALRDGDSVIVKHIELVRSAAGDFPRIRCISANKTYAPFELDLDGDSVAIIGRVAARISRM